MKNTILSLFLLCLLTGCASTKDPTGILTEFNHSTTIKEWKEALQIDGEKVQLNAVGGRYGYVRIVYEDEETYRSIYEYTDYLYVDEIRISKDSIIFVKIKGVASGIWETSEIIPFDLKNRKKMKAQPVVMGND